MNILLSVVSLFQGYFKKCSIRKILEKKKINMKKRYSLKHIPSGKFVHVIEGNMVKQ
jgi:hypothetical protein